MADPDKLLFIITRPDLGGAQSHVKALLTGFAQTYELHLAIGSLGPLTDALQDLALSIHVLPALIRPIQPVQDMRAVQQCTALIRQIRPDLIHAHSSKAGIVARIAGRRERIPVVFTAHGWAFAPEAPPLRRRLALVIEKLIAPLTTELICVSGQDYRLAMQLGVGRPQHANIIRYGIQPGAPLADPRQSPPRLVMVARFNEQKDQETLLRAIAQLKCPEVQLEFIGSGPTLATCQQLAKSLGIAEQVIFSGDCTDVEQRLAQAQLFILSTHYEGLPISILEAMRAGLPVVATQVDGIPEEVTDGETGFLTAHADLDSLVRALHKLLHNSELRQQMGTAGRHKFLSQFTLERMLTETEAIYHKILG